MRYAVARRGFRRTRQILTFGGMQTKQLEELVLQSLEHELGGVKLYETALTCAVHPELKQEWQQYLDETRTHVMVLEEVCRVMSIDPKQETPGRGVVRSVGAA